MLSDKVKQLAVQSANRYGVPIDLMLATVEAESPNNATGDSGNALGYGQVWPKWHYDEMKYAAAQWGIALPSKDDMNGLRSLYENNEVLSMDTAALVIKNVWNAAGQNWDKFTRMYVGPAIPQADYNRRLNIYNSYRGTSTGAVPALLDGAQKLFENGNMTGYALAIAGAAAVLLVLKK